MMKLHWFNLLTIVINLVMAVAMYRHYPHWSGMAVGCALWGFADAVRTWPRIPSTHNRNYDVGWTDGWNACRSAKPEERVFRRADKA
jgi:hypothetical protein